MNNRVNLVPSMQETHILLALNEIRKLVFYKLGSKHEQSAEDLIQKVFYKIWSWKLRHNKILEYEDWRKITRTVIYREISEYFSEKYTSDIVFSQIEDSLLETLFTAGPVQNNPEGNTQVEINSILLLFWKGAQILTLRQRYAFVLQNESFLIEFISAEVCNFNDLAAYFDVTEEILSNMLEFFPLSDKQIGEILTAKLDKEITPQQIWEARAKAKAKLYKFINQPTR